MSDPRREAIETAREALMLLDGTEDYTKSERRAIAAVGFNALDAALDATEPAETQPVAHDEETCAAAWNAMREDRDYWRRMAGFFVNAAADAELEAASRAVRRPVPSATPAAEPFDPNQSTGWHGGGTADKEK